MRGKVLAAPGASAPGVIAGDDGQRYRFAAPDLGGSAIRVGQAVDFVAEQGDARQVYAVPGAEPILAPSVAQLLSERDWLAFYFSPEGRIGRRDYWLFGFLVLLVVNLFLSILPLINMIGPVVILWCSLALAIKRCHDVNRSGWWNLIFLAPLPIALIGMVAGMTSGGTATGITLLIACALVEFALCIWFVVAVLARPGDAGPNRFGPPPVTETT